MVLKKGIEILVGQAVLSDGSKQTKWCSDQKHKNCLAYWNDVKENLNFKKFWKKMKLVNLSSALDMVCKGLTTHSK